MIDIRIRLPKIRLPKLPPLGKYARPLAIAVIAASLLMSGASMYVALAAPSRASYVPSTVGFEGQLLNSSGQPVTNGNYSVTFRLYSQASGGTALWSETQTVSVTNGLYSVQLGSVTSLNASHFDGARWLGVQVAGDSEMTPRLAISAVPFALNARMAMGLQGYDVSSNAPASNNTLIWNGSAWAPQGMTVPNLSAVGSNAAPQDFFSAYRSGAILRYLNSTTVEVSVGEVMVNGYMRRNTAAVNVSFSGSPSGPNRGLDTGTAQSGTTYYIYAVADDSESTFDLIISASSTAPTGVTNYRKLGSFATFAGSTDVQPGSVAIFGGASRIVPAARVFNNASVSIPHATLTAVTFNSERFDNDELHNTTSNTTRLTVTTPGRYMIGGNIAWATIGGNDERRLEIRLNGTTTIASLQQVGNGGANITMHLEITTLYYLAANDYVELIVYQSSGSSMSLSATGNYTPEFWIVWVGD